MERRVQSLVDVLSAVYHFLQEQKRAKPSLAPLLTSSWPSSSPSKRAGGGGSGGGGGGGCGRKGNSKKGTGVIINSSAGCNVFDETDAMEVSSEGGGGGAGERGGASALSRVYEGGGTETGTEVVAGAGEMAQFAALAEKPPLRLLGDAEVVEALWSGKQSMMRRLLRRLEGVYSEKFIVEPPEKAAREEVAKSGVEQQVKYINIYFNFSFVIIA